MADVRKAPYDAVAKEAFQYVRKNMWIGAKNRLLDQPTVFGVPGMDLGARAGCVDRMREESEKVLVPMRDRNVKELGKRLVDTYGWAEEGKTVHAPPETVAAEYAAMRFETYGKAVDVYAAYAFSYGCGNCMEQSALTFQYLRDRGVRPLDWIAQEALFTVPLLGVDMGDHAFVVIGRDGTKDVGDVTKWNPEVFWCDPYENEMGGLDRIRERFEGKSLSLMYRLD